MDIEKIESWIQLAEENGLTFLCIEEEDWGIEVSLPRHAPAAPAPAPTQTAVAEDADPKDEPSTIEVKSLWVGYFRNPSEKFTAGAVVEPEEVLGEVETLGLSNPITVPTAGSLREVLVQDGDPVQYGQVVAVLEPKR
ncbi:MAG: hypothetical protein KatS3mg015_0423 [Fimbriimonadales bacterium]|nr:MAG: hypothetical protein KatS3mg015_0423 [Fimbriimonadales bacterium]